MCHSGLMMRFGVVVLAVGACVGQTPAELSRDVHVQAAMEAAKRNEPGTLELQARICEIPAPPFQEAIFWFPTSKLHRAPSPRIAWSRLPTYGQAQEVGLTFLPAPSIPLALRSRGRM